MKNTITLLILVILNINVSAQIDFFKFIESIKWNSTESEIVKQYSTLIEKRKHETNDIYHFEVNYGIDKIILGGYNFNAAFSISIKTKKLIFLRFMINEQPSISNVSPKILSNYLDSIFIEKYGLPDVKVDDDEYVFSSDRKWHNENTIVQVFQLGSTYIIKMVQLNENSLKELQREVRIRAKYADKIAIKIIDSKFWIGMTSEMAKESLGIPNDINRTVGSWGVHEQWVYGNTYLYFENGILTSYQN